ncbi:MAG: hypothetical protein FJ100_22910 [Deltaproteobacteria bacterium]|nr:hypothetical protein [Deltaproteobacteria bacterium]
MPRFLNHRTLVAPVLRLLALCTFAAAVQVATAAPAAAEANWEFVGVIDGVKVWRRESPDSPLLSFKGEITADVHIGKILAVFLDRNQRKHWVDRFDDTKELEKPNPLSETYWIKFKLPIGISNRDYVFKADGTADAANGLFLAKIKSVEHPKAPVNDCCVRAEAKGTYYRFEAQKGVEKTRLVVEVSTDPKGMLPNWLVNLIQKSWPSKTLNGLVRRANSAGIAPHPDYAEWHARP